jgi:putative membrane protein
MLRTVLAHAGQPPKPHDVWSAWNLDPWLLAGFVLLGWVYWRGEVRCRPRALDTWRARGFAAALVALGVAFITPLEAVSTALASAHMVQHILVLLVAAPLLAWSAPTSTLLRGSPLTVRRAAGRWRRRLGMTATTLRAFRHPVAAWLLHVGTLWFWHAAVPYDAALGNELVHVVEHATFLGTGVLFWHTVIGARSAGRVSPGLGVMLVFGMSMQSVALSLLLTFAPTPWYSGYAETTIAWGLEPLADQQLAGVIMWIPGGVVYLAVALILLVVWMQTSEGETRAARAE